MRKHYEKVLASADSSIKMMMNLQDLDETDSDYGGFRGPDNLTGPRTSVYFSISMIAVYSNKDSIWYKNLDLAHRILIGLDHLERCQHENGLFDLNRCNFFSAPDSAFIQIQLLKGLHLLHDTNRDEAQEQIYEKLYKIGRKTAFGLLEGGFHTPNHRWAIASALVESGAFFEEPKLTAEADIYLREGIDCNEDGAFSERSVGNYDRVNNDAMITLGKYLDPSYYQYAIRNLKMIYNYIEPDGSIYTYNSTRQDKGRKVSPVDYYWEYLLLGNDCSIPEFLGFANTLFDMAIKKNSHIPDILIDYMIRPDLIDLEYEGNFYPTTYKKLFAESGVARVRNKNVSYTLMKGKSDFLHLSNTSIDLAVRIGGSLCEHRAFIPETLEETDEGYVLTQVMKGWYYLPFKEKPDTSDWWKMDQSKREKKHGPDLSICVTVRETENGIALHMKLDGVENAPFRVEVYVSGASQIDHESFTMRGLSGKNMVVKDGYVRLSNFRDCFEIGPGFGTHLALGDDSGSDSPFKDAFTLYFTDSTEFEHTIYFRNITT